VNPRAGVALAGAGVAVVAAAWAVRWRDPRVPGSWGICSWLLATGTPCPTCGGLRALAYLTEGDVATAWGYHPYLVITLALAPLLLAVAWRLRRRWAWIALGWPVGWVVFGVLRILTPGWWPPSPVL
jgi:hypothetical protein